MFNQTRSKFNQTRSKALGPLYYSGFKGLCCQEEQNNTTRYADKGPLTQIYTTNEYIYRKLYDIVYINLYVHNNMYQVYQEIRVNKSIQYNDLYKKSIQSTQSTAKKTHFQKSYTQDMKKCVYQVYFVYQNTLNSLYYKDLFWYIFPYFLVHKVHPIHDILYNFYISRNEYLYTSQIVTIYRLDSMHVYKKSLITPIIIASYYYHNVPPFTLKKYDIYLFTCSMKYSIIGPWTGDRGKGSTIHGQGKRLH